jgi:hypothetical protein
MNKTKKLSNNKRTKVQKKNRKRLFRKTKKISYKGGIIIRGKDYNIRGSIRNFTKKIKNKIASIANKITSIKTVFSKSNNNKIEEEKTEVEKIILENSKFDDVVYAELKDTYLKYKISDASRITKGDITFYAFYNRNINNRLLLLRNIFIRIPDVLIKDLSKIIKILVYVISIIPTNALALTFIIVFFSFLGRGDGESILFEPNNAIFSRLMENYNKLKTPTYVSKDFAFLEKIANRFSINSNELEDITTDKSKLDSSSKDFEKIKLNDEDVILFIYDSNKKHFVISSRENKNNVFVFKKSETTNTLLDIFDYIKRSEFSKWDSFLNADLNYIDSKKENVFFGNLDKEKLDKLFEQINKTERPIDIDLSVEDIDIVNINNNIEKIDSEIDSEIKSNQDQDKNKEGIIDIIDKEDKIIEKLINPKVLVDEEDKIINEGIDINEGIINESDIKEDNIRKVENTRRSRMSRSKRFNAPRSIKP